MVPAVYKKVSQAQMLHQDEDYYVSRNAVVLGK